MIRVVVVDDDPLTRGAIATLVNAAQGMSVVADAADGQDALTQARAERPDVILMDVRMPGIGGVEATHAVVKDGLTTDNGHPVRIIILTVYHADDAVYAALRAGASGFLLKDDAPEQIVSAIRAVASGDAWLNPAVTRQLIDKFNAQPEQHAATPAQMAQLTAREREVLVLLAQGMDNAGVAGKLFISEHTVKTHLANVMKKLGVREKAQAVIAAYQCGLVQGGNLHQDR